MIKDIDRIDVDLKEHLDRYSIEEFSIDLLKDTRGGKEFNGMQYIINTTLEKVSDKIIRRFKDRFIRSTTSDHSNERNQSTNPINSKSLNISSQSIENKSNLKSSSFFKSKAQLDTKNPKESFENVELLRDHSESIKSNSKERSTAVKFNQESQDISIKRISQETINKQKETSRPRKAKKLRKGKSTQVKSLMNNTLKSKIKLEQSPEEKYMKSSERVEEEVKETESEIEYQVRSPKIKVSINKKSQKKSSEPESFTDAQIMDQKKQRDSKNLESSNFEFNNLIIKESRENNLLNKSIAEVSFSKQIQFINGNSKDSFTTVKLNTQGEESKEDEFERIKIQEASFQDESQMDMEEYERRDSISPSNIARVKRVRSDRKSLEKGLFGLRTDLRKIEDDIYNFLDKHTEEIDEIKSDFEQFRLETQDNVVVLREELHNTYTQFQGHINNVLIEYKDSILIIQSHVDNQLLINKRNRTDMNIILDTILAKASFHDKVSKNFHFAMGDMKEVLDSLTESININYHLLKQDEKDRESIYLMGLNQNTQQIGYNKGREITPITLNKNCLSCSGQVTETLKAFKAACLSYSPSNVMYKGLNLSRLNLID